MADLGGIRLLGPILFLLLASSYSAEANRCDYAATPFDNVTVWKEKGEDVTLSCPGYRPDTSWSGNIEYSWYRQAYNCKEMNQATRIAHYDSLFEERPQEDITQKGKITLNQTSGQLTIRNLTITDEQSLTCLFVSFQDYVATVRLKIKDFGLPIFTKIPEVIHEGEVSYAECIVPKMQPTKGFIEVKQNGKIVYSVELVEGQQLPSMVVPIEGEAQPKGCNVTCTAVQNVSGTAKELSASFQVKVLYSYHTKVISSQSDPVIEFSDVTLSCEATRRGNPKDISKYTWKKDGHEIYADQKISLRNITKDNSGLYKCLITNTHNITTPLSAAQEWQLDVASLLLKSNMTIFSIAGYILGGIGLVVVVGFICWAICSHKRASKKRKCEITEVDEGHYEDVGKLASCSMEDQSNNSARKDLAGSSATIGHVEDKEDKDLPEEHMEGACGFSLSQSTSSFPIPALPPCVRDSLSGSGSLDCPEAEQPYKNLTAIVATIQRKPHFNVAKAEALQTLLEHCKESYGMIPIKLETKEGLTSSGDYVDMEDCQGGKVKTNSDVSSICRSLEEHQVSQLEDTSEYMDMGSAAVDEGKAIESLEQ